MLCELHGVLLDLEAEIRALKHTREETIGRLPKPEADDPTTLHPLPDVAAAGTEPTGPPGLATGCNLKTLKLTAEQKDEAETLLKLIRLGWGRDNPAFRQVFTSQFIPDGTHEQHQWFNDLERLSASAENAVRIVEALYQLDVTAEAARLRVPTLILHSRLDERVPFEEGQRLATLIPSSRFVPLEGRNHVLLRQEPAWARFVEEFRAFLDTGAGPGRLDDAGLTASEREVLALLARGLDNTEIAKSLAKSEKTVRNQVSSIFAKLGVHTRAQAVALARDQGIGRPA